MSLRLFRMMVGIAIALFALTIIMWKPLSGMVAEATGCSSVGGACGAVLTMFGLYGRGALILLVTLLFLAIIVLRSRTLGLSLFVTLNGLAVFPHLAQLTNTLNNFWGVGFASGATGLGGILSLMPLALAIGPMIVSGLVLWNLASKRRETVFQNFPHNPVLMRPLLVFSAIYLAGSILPFLTMLAILPGMGDIVLWISKMLVWPVLILGAVNLLLGIGAISFLLFAIGRSPLEVRADDEEQGAWHDPEPA